MTEVVRWFFVFVAAVVAVVALNPRNGLTGGVRGLLAFVAASVIVVALAPLATRRRRRAMQTAASKIGFAYQGEDWIYPTPRPQLGSALFVQSQGWCTNVMTGIAEGFNTSLFDYSYSGRPARTQTVAAFSQELWLPLFEVRPNSFSDPVRDFYIDGDIGSVFTGRYVLRGPEEDKIRALFTPDLAPALESLTLEGRWHIEGMGLTLILYRAGVTVHADQLPAFLQQTALIARTFFNLCGLRKPVA